MIAWAGAERYRLGLLGEVPSSEGSDEERVRG